MSFQLFEAVSCGGEKKIHAPGNYCSGMVFGIALAQPPSHKKRKEINNMETAHCIGAEEDTNLVLIKEENNSWLSQSPTFIWYALLQSHPGKLHDIFITVIFRLGHYL